MMEIGTFSILALSNNPPLLGIAVASGSTGVGSGVPHAKPGIGGVVTQAYTSITYGVEGLKLLELGFSPVEVLNSLLARDSEREMRQVALMDFAGRKAVFTGSMVPRFHGEIIAEDYVVIGNLLRNDRVLKCVAENFKNSRGAMARRMLEALRAGSICGGDCRGERSAAIIVVDKEHLRVNLRVDYSKNPIQELLNRL